MKNSFVRCWKTRSERNARGGNAKKRKVFDWPNYSKEVEVMEVGWVDWTIPGKFAECWQRMMKNWRGCWPTRSTRGISTHRRSPWVRARNSLESCRGRKRSG